MTPAGRLRVPPGRLLLLLLRMMPPTICTEGAEWGLGAIAACLSGDQGRGPTANSLFGGERLLPLPGAAPSTRDSKGRVQARDVLASGPGCGLASVPACCLPKRPRCWAEEGFKTGRVPRPPCLRGVSHAIGGAF